MTSFEISTIIDQPVEIVVKALMNPDNFPFWTTDLLKFEVIKGKPGEVGSIGHLHYLQRGRPYIMEDKLIFCEQGKKYVSRVTGDAISAEVETILNPGINVTEMTVKWTGEGKMLFLKLFLPLFRRKLIRQSKSELEIFKNLVETKGFNFSEGEKEPA